MEPGEKARQRLVQVGLSTTSRGRGFDSRQGEADLPGAGHHASGDAVCPCDSVGDGPGDGIPTILVVEDNVDMREYLASQLAGLGRVVTANDGRSALIMVRSLMPDVIVTDIMMPVMDGLELARSVRSDPALTRVKVVLVTARSGADASVEGLTVADDYITKPFSVKELMARVRNQLRGGQTRSGLGSGSQGESLPGPVAVDAGGADAEHTGSGGVKPRRAEPTETAVAFVARLVAVATEHLVRTGFSAALLAAEVGLSPRQLQRKCREATGVSPTDFIRQVRMEKAMSLLRSGAFETVAQVAVAVGMSPAHFSQVYSAWHGHSPSIDLKRRQ